MKLLHEGTFDLKGKSVPGFLKVYGWCQDLPKRLEKPAPLIKKAKKKGK